MVALERGVEILWNNAGYAPASTELFGAMHDVSQWLGFASDREYIDTLTTERERRFRRAKEGK